VVTATKEVKQPKLLPPPNSDFYELVETLHPDELALVRQVRAFMDSNCAEIDRCRREIDEEFGLTGPAIVAEREVEEGYDNPGGDEPPDDGDHAQPYQRDVWRLGRETSERCSAVPAEDLGQRDQAHNVEDDPDAFAKRP
jgi:hypothetical protein